MITSEASCLLEVILFASKASEHFKISLYHCSLLKMREFVPITVICSYAVTLPSLELIILCYYSYLYTMSDVAMQEKTKYQRLSE